ncbi:MAG: hypothetical protein QOF68_112 [Gaiellales bacterium]|nr:hypothetical protein [Gaiellales bacterium]
MVAEDVCRASAVDIDAVPDQGRRPGDGELANRGVVRPATSTIAVCCGSPTITAGALMTAASGVLERSVRLFLPAGTTTCSVYAPAHTRIVSPDAAAVTAAWIDVNVAAGQSALGGSSTVSVAANADPTPIVSCAATAATSQSKSFLRKMSPLPGRRMRRPGDRVYVASAEWHPPMSPQTLCPEPARFIAYVTTTLEVRSMWRQSGMYQPNTSISNGISLYNRPTPRLYPKTRG